MEDDKWRAKLTAGARKVGVEERMIALEDERLAKEKQSKEHAIMFMNPSPMDATEGGIGNSPVGRSWPNRRSDVVVMMMVVDIVVLVVVMSTEKLKFV